MQYEQTNKLKNSQTLTVNKLILFDSNSKTMPTHYTFDFTDTQIHKTEKVTEGHHLTF